MTTLNKNTILIITILLTACVKTFTLNNGIQKAAVSSKVFKNKKYFYSSLLTQIDTSIIYEEYNTDYYEGMVKQANILSRLNYNDPNTLYGVYRFYSNGNFSLFFLDRNNPKLDKNMFNPNYGGWRGVVYKKKNKIKGDMFTQVGQLSWQLGKETYNLEFVGDTLIVELPNKNKELYVKRHIDYTFLDYKANW